MVQGSWTSSDEACPNYEDLILNMYLGHQFLKNEFGITPTIGWMLDNSGHSATNARLFIEFGFEALFLARVHDQERDTLKKQHSLNFLYRP